MAMDSDLIWQKNRSGALYLEKREIFKNSIE